MFGPGRTKSELPSSREPIEQVCIRNLLGSREERVFFKDLESRYLMVSEGWLASEGQGRSLAEVIGKTDFDIFSRPHAIAAREDEQRIIRTGEPIIGKVERETFHNRPDVWVSTTKLPLLDEHRHIIGTFGTARDVTAQMRDSVTGLANRLALIDRLTQALVALERQPRRLALLFLDVDGFKPINDALGHATGDRVLIEVGRRLIGAARRFDTVARYGGDEFVLLCTALRHEEDLHQIAERVVEAVCAPVAVDGNPGLTISASVGGVVCGDPRADPEQLIRQADTAMYAAKRGGRGRFEVYDGAVHGNGGPAAEDRPRRSISRNRSCASMGTSVSMIAG